MPQLKRSKYEIIGDAVGLAHCIVANLVVLAGYFVDFFKSADPFDGLKLIYQYVDHPVFLLFRGQAAALEHDKVFLPVMLGEAVIILSSLLYGFIAFLIAWLVFPARD